MTQFITLCAGLSKRFNGKPKHLLELYGETILGRQVNQFNPIIADSDLVGHTEWTCETLLKTKPYWADDRVGILLGDVFYTEATAQKIINAFGSITFWSDLQDIFAITFGPSDFEKIIECATKVIEPDGIEVHNLGRLWELYRKLKNLDNSAPLPPDDREYLELISDETQDFDDEVDCENFKAGISKNRLMKQNIL